MSAVGILSLVLCIFLAMAIGIYVGNLIRNKRREKGGRIKGDRNRH